MKVEAEIDWELLRKVEQLVHAGFTVDELERWVKHTSYQRAYHRRRYQKFKDMKRLLKEGEETK